MTEELAQLKAERAAIDARINLVERGIEKAAYDASMQSQLVTLNEARIRDGKPTLTMTQFSSGCFVDGEEQP